MKRAIFPALMMAAVAVFFSLAALASANESIEGPSYGEKVEPICRAYVEASERLRPKNVFPTNKALNSPHRQARIFAKEAKYLRGAVIQLEAVPQPEANRATFGKWFGYLKNIVSLMERTSKALKVDDKPKARRLVTQIEYNVKLANETVASFEFHYCKLNPARF